MLESHRSKKMSKLNFQPEFTVRADGKYDLEDFLSLYDKKFIKAAYLALLLREPDAEGERHWLAKVRAGTSKIWILSQMLESQEGRRHKVKVARLKEARLIEKIFNVPVVGRVVRGVCFFLNVENYLKDSRALENYVIRMAEELQQQYYQDRYQESVKPAGQSDGSDEL